ncbi:retropepsin-like aspartic protease family protein [Glacieibacterium frigidum]|uniref:TIGR02281 family clan AA aspartic protease n=1 Tax=Glacieibacterium frigidum TaxID=2593303 RepID=A0A552UHY5_9SPHN|nr:retropepsin-like aspartic protease [Glacieibacterium frigidum]TRW17832.1 TIGR02281 family clan AA aspartic protease [Glacieibacterium frigidum]
MSLLTDPEARLALIAAGVALVLIVLFSLPRVGAVIRSLFSFALLAFGIYLVLQQAPFIPGLARLTDVLGLDNQRVTGSEVRIRMSPDGHFWVNVRINGTPVRMLVDSGATVTAISERTATLAAIPRSAGLMPIVLRTANGNVAAKAGSIDRLTLGSIEAQNLKVVTSPALGDVNVLGMNFLSRLAEWRVEGRTLRLIPTAEVGEGGAASPTR